MMKNKFSLTAVIFIAGIILAGVIAARAIQEAYRNQKIEKEINALKQEAQNIQNENSTLQKQIDYYSTSQFIEKVSKDKMDMQKPGENVVVVSQEVAQKPQAVSEEIKVSNTEQDLPNYVKWWNLFFKYN
jgi:cell division protein FtsB